MYRQTTRSREQIARMIAARDQRPRRVRPQAQGGDVVTQEVICQK